MYKLGRHHVLVGIIILFIAFFACEKEPIRLDFPTVTTDEFHKYSPSIGSAQINGGINRISTTVIKIGFEWGIKTDTLSFKWDSTLNMTLANFHADISDLILNQTYYYRAFADFKDPEHIDSIRRVFGEIKSLFLGVKISVPQEIPTRNNTVILGGQVEGLDNNTMVMQHGYVFNSDPMMTPVVNDGISHILDLGIWDGQKSFKDSILVNLVFNTTYFYRAWMKTAETTYYSLNTGSFVVHDGWKRITDVENKFQEGVAASNDQKAYVIGGCGSNTECEEDDGNNNFVLTYDNISDSWSDLNITPLGYPRHNAIAFILNDTLYFGLGEGSNFSEAPRKTVFKLDEQGKSWVNVSAFSDVTIPGRSRAVSFCLNNKAYFGTGWGEGSKLMSDFWEFDPILNKCRRVANLPVQISKNDYNQGRMNAIAFIQGGFGFVMGGITNEFYYLKDVWKFTPPVTSQDTGHWDFVTFFPGEARSRSVAFTINDRAFITTGHNPTVGLLQLDDLWEFVPEHTTGSYFELRTRFEGGKREQAVAFVLGGNAYVGSGYSTNDVGVGKTYFDFWQYTPRKD